MKKKIIITQLLYNIKKSHQFISSLQYEKYSIREKKNFKRKQNKIENILKGKNLRERN
jgi:hypothetical protein